MSVSAPVQITHPEKILWPEVGIRKIDYLLYLHKVSSVILPHLRDRPITLIRYPHGAAGASFYQKNIPVGAPEWLCAYTDASGHKPIHYALIQDLDSLLWAGNQNSLELHTAYATTRQPAYPTQLAIDLDPTTDEFEDAREVAFYVKDALAAMGLSGYPNTSGKTGIQIYVPVAPRYTFAQTRKVLRLLADYVVTKHPQSITLEARLKDRGTLVYFDFRQHAEHKTLVAPYSPRSHPLATVSTPVTWDELAQGIRPEQLTIQTVPDRLLRHGDLFASLVQPKGSLDDILQFLGNRPR